MLFIQLNFSRSLLPASVLRLAVFCQFLTGLFWLLLLLIISFLGTILLFSSSYPPSHWVLQEADAKLELKVQSICWDNICRRKREGAGLGRG